MNHTQTMKPERWLGALAIILAIVLWEIFADFIVGDVFYLPSPSDVILAFISLVQSGTLLMDIEVSLLHFAIGIGYMHGDSSRGLQFI